MVKYPSKRLVIPTDLKNEPNGKLPESKLTKIAVGGKLWTWAAVSFNVMYSAAKKDGILFENQGDYRPYARQVAMFKERYSTRDEGRIPQVTRTWNGRLHFLRKGESPSATPGTSNHGLGLAIDLKVADPRVFVWLCKNAPTYGFYLQGSDPKSAEFEGWHWQYCDGDKVPKVVKKALQTYIEAIKSKG